MCILFISIMKQIFQRILFLILGIKGILDIVYWLVFCIYLCIEIL